MRPALAAALLALAALLVPAAPSHAASDGPTRAVSDPDLVDAIAMAGPYGSLAEICLSQDLLPAFCTDPPIHCGAAATVPLHVDPPFLEANVIEWPEACEFALRTAAGWWIPDWRALGLHARFRHHGRRFASELTALDPLADGIVAVRGTFIGRDSEDAPWFACIPRVVVCAVGPSGTPSCTRDIAVGYHEQCLPATAVSAAPRGSPPRPGSPSSPRSPQRPPGPPDFEARATITRVQVRVARPAAAGGPFHVNLRFP